MLEVITDNLDIWTTAQKQKKAVGRGRAKKDESYGVKKLRELILELAVRGMLVPQDASDQPASVLLKNIEEEKSQLVEEGVIKNKKSFPKIEGEEKPFKLPVGWNWVRLAEIGDIYTGNSISVRVKEEKYTNTNHGLSYIATKDVGYGWANFDYGNGVLIPRDEPKFKIAKEGAVLICAEGGSAGKKCGIANQDICFGNKLLANNLFGNIEPSYVLANYLSPTFFYKFKSNMTGIIGGISTAKFIQLVIPLPPLAEQHRIVAKVDELMALCDQLEQEQADHQITHQTLVETLLNGLVESAKSQAKNEASDQQSTADYFNQLIAEHFDTLFTTEQSIDYLKQTILQLAVMGKLVPQDPKDEPASVLLEKIAEEKIRLIKAGKIKKQKDLPEIGEGEKPFELPNGWEWVSFGELIKSFTNGLYKKSSFYSDSGVISLRMYNIQDGKVEFSNVRRVNVSEEELSQYSLEENDLLINRVNSKELVGKTALIPKMSEPLLFESMNMRAKPHINYLESAYLNLYMRTELAKLFLLANAKEAISQASLNQGQISSLPIPLPAREEQNRIVSKVNQLLSLCDSLKANINQAQTTQTQLADAIVKQAIN